MKNQTYIYNLSELSTEETHDCIQHYAKRNQLTALYEINDDAHSKTHWQKRQIRDLLDLVTTHAGDNIIIYDTTHIARSTGQALEFLVSAFKQGINIHFAKYNKALLVNEISSLMDALSLMQHIESDYISRRTTEALARRRAAGLPLGRPKGRKNKSLKLDKHKKDIFKYMDIGISKASIAKLVGCHPQTLYDWLVRHETHNIAKHHEPAEA